MAAEATVASSTLSNAESNNNSNQCDTEESNQDATGRQEDHSTESKPIDTLQLAVIVFYTVSGGPFGLEAAIRAGGAFYTLLGFTIMPLVWSLPEALVTSELGTAYPEASGSVAWVEEAFGPALGWISGALTWFSGATDNAIYPVLFLDYVLQLQGKGANPIDGMFRYAIVSGLCIFLSFINYLGLTVVGNMSILVFLVSMSPFVVFCMIGVFHIQPSRWLEVPVPGVNMTNIDDDVSGGFFPNAVLGGVLWRPFLNNLFWNLNSYDSAASFAGEVRDYGKSFPRAMMAGVVMAALGYLIPLLVALGSSDARQEDWVDGYMATAATNVAGPWLGYWFVFAVGISNLGLFQAEMSSDAYSLLGMAERGYLPKFFARRSRFGTPTAGIVTGTIVILCLTMTDLGALIEMLNFNYAISLLFEYAAFIALRITKPEVPRPFKIPLGTAGCIAMLVPNVIMLLVVIALATYTTLIYCVITFVFSVILYWCRQRRAPEGYTSLHNVSQADSGTSAPSI